MAQTNQALIDMLKHGLRKGQQVTFKQGGETKKGVVERGGKTKATVVLFGNPEKAVRGSIFCFTPTEFDLVEDPSPDPMAGYEIRNHRIVPKMCDDTIAYHAEVWKDGEKIIEASNNGGGGPDNFWPCQKGSTFAVVKAFQDDADAWARECGRNKPFESGGMWVEWYVNQRPYGVTARAYMQEFVRKCS